MQNSIQKFRQSSIVFDKLSILSEMQILHLFKFFLTKLRPLQIENA